MRIGADGLVNYVPMGGLAEEEAAAAREEERQAEEAAAEELAARVLRVVKDDARNGRAANEAALASRVKNYNIYRARGDGRQEREGRSRIKSSDAMDAIEWMMPSFMKTFAGSASCVTVSPVGTEDVTKAEKLEKLLNWQFMGRRVNGFRVLYEWIKASLIYGTSVVKVTWRDIYVNKGFDIPLLGEEEILRMTESEDYVDVSGKPEDVPAGSPVGADVVEAAKTQPDVMSSIAPAGTVPGAGPVFAATRPFRLYRNVRGTRRVKTYSGPMVEVISPEDFWMDPKASSVADAQFVIHRVWRTYGELRRMERDGIYRNVDKVRDSADKSGERFDNAEAAARYEAAGQQPEASSYAQTDDELQPARRKLEVFEWWGMLDLKGDGYQEPYLVVVCGDTILRMEKNPYGHGQAPFEVLRPMLDPFSFWGIGMPELVGEFQELKTAILRQTLDNVSFQNNGMWLVNRNAGVDMKALLNPRPGTIVRTNIVQGAVTPITPPSLQSMPLNMLELADSMLQKRTGVTSYNQGLDANSLNKTATGITRIMNASAQRIELIARVMAETGIKPLYQKLLMLNQQFVDQKIVIRVFNAPIEISPDDLAGEFDVDVDVGGATGRDETKSQQMMMLLQYAANLMQLQVMRPENVYEICRRIMELWGWKDYDKYLTDPGEAEKLRGAMAIIEQLASAVNAGQMPRAPVVAQAFRRIYDILNSVLGAAASENMPLSGSPGGAEVQQAGGGADSGEYTATTIPGRSFNGAAAFGA